MTRKINITLILLFFGLSNYTFSQSSEIRTVTKTPRNGHSMYRSSTGDKQLMTYVDDEETPFTGKFIEKGFKDELLSEKNFVNGIMEGEYLEYDTRGDETYISIKGHYKNDKKVGEWIEWWRPNHKKSVINYDENGELHGSYTQYEGFSVEEPNTTQNYNHGKRDGKFKWFYSGQKIKSTKYYKNGLQEGLDIDYYENGNKKFEENYLNDQKNGTSKKWYENGQVRMTVEYKDNKKNGKEIFFYKNGQKEKEGKYQANMKLGNFVWYKEDGSIIEETTF